MGERGSRINHTSSLKKNGRKGGGGKLKERKIHFSEKGGYSEKKKRTGGCQKRGGLPSILSGEKNGGKGRGMNKEGELDAYFPLEQRGKRKKMGVIFLFGEGKKGLKERADLPDGEEGEKRGGKLEFLLLPRGEQKTEKKERHLYFFGEEGGGKKMGG